ncbi:integumentary mucin B.1-like [Ambystoma mexicanum]|uniref:integumentary mucin B.1-like n=1 Tax=Ambystoma mexicanum TaxID=8296 RepID=UPI0037E79D03
MEGSGQDECCSEHSCECQPCPPSPVCGSGYLAEELPDNSGKYCCPQFTCTPIPTTPPATTTPEFCAYVTCQDITCGPHERLVELPKPSQACCTPFECERITTIPGTTPPVPTTPERCAHVTCTVKACKPHETLVERPRAPESCCPVYECECQCDSVPRCERDERLVPVRQAHQCCPKLKCVPKKDECHPISKAVQLRDGECSATVKLQSCSGYCHSSTSYSHLWEPVPHCRCCSAKQLLSKKFQIPCPNGTKTTVLVKEAESCHCLSCSGGDESSEEQSGDSEEMQLLP